jgi:poly-beta-1,6-N-acetyl-D-glucosamine biosynthesis protein PgaD
MKSLIIDRPDKRSLQQKYIDNSLKTIMFLSWLYLALPALTFGIWYIAYTFFNQHLVLLEGYKEYKTITSYWYLLIIITMLVLIFAWSKGNKHFSKKDSTNQADTCLPIHESSKFFHLTEEDILRYRNMKKITIRYDDVGRIVQVTTP